MKRSETFKSLLRAWLSWLNDSEVKTLALKSTSAGGLMMIPRREVPWVVYLPWHLTGRLAGAVGADRETAGASEGGGRLLREGGAATAFTRALTLAGLGTDGLILAHLAGGGLDPAGP